MKTNSNLGSAFLTALSFATLCTGSTAQDWPNWRGPNHDGSAEARDLPVKFTTKKMVRWATELPGPGAGTPIVVGDRIFLPSVNTKKEALVAICIDRRTGKVMWEKEAGSGYMSSRARSKTHGARTTFASPSPATDGEQVVFFFGNGDLVAFDLAGKELWRRNIQKDYGEFAFNWTFSASPTIWEGKLFLPVLQRDVPIGRGGGRGRGGRGGTDQEEQPAKIDSFILAMDPKTGKTIYKHVRPAPARMESLESYTTLIPYVDKDGGKQLLLVGGDVLTGHDPATGKELWRWGTWNPGHRQGAWRLVPTVVVGSGMAVVCAPKRAPVYAVKLGGKGELDAKEAVAWKSEGRPNPVSSDVPTPAFAGGFFYVLSDVQNALSKVDPKDGKAVWTTSLSRDYLWRASPTVADGKVYCMNHNGEVAVIDAESGKALHHAFMGDADDDQTRSSVVVAHNQLFIRTNSKLYCIAKEKQ